VAGSLTSCSISTVVYWSMISVTAIAVLAMHKVDHEARIRFLEKEQWIHRGGIAAISFIAAKIGFGGLFVR
jgi:hypothetical protein